MNWRGECVALYAELRRASVPAARRGGFFARGGRIAAAIAEHGFPQSRRARRGGHRGARWCYGARPQTQPPTGTFAGAAHWIEERSARSHRGIRRRHPPLYGDGGSGSGGQDALYRAIAGNCRGGFGCSRSHSRCNFPITGSRSGDGAYCVATAISKALARAWLPQRAASPPFGNELRNSDKARKRDAAE